MDARLSRHLPISRAKKLVEGLRDYSQAPPVKIYRALPDGTRELIAVKPAPTVEECIVRNKRYHHA